MNRLTWDEMESAYIDLPSGSEVELSMAACPEHEMCFSCGLKFHKEAKALFRPLPGGGFSQHGVNYHVHDFVYIKPKARDGLYIIAQITKVKAMSEFPQVSVRVFGRYDDVDEAVRKKRSSSCYLSSDEVRYSYFLLTRRLYPKHHPSVVSSGRQST